MKALERMGAERFVAIPRYSNVERTIDNIEDTEWVNIGYTEDGEAQVAETTIFTEIGDRLQGLRLVVRRTCLTDPKQA